MLTIALVCLAMFTAASLMYLTLMGILVYVLWVLEEGHRCVGLPQCWICLGPEYSWWASKATEETLMGLLACSGLAGTISGSLWYFGK